MHNDVPSISPAKSISLQMIFSVNARDRCRGVEKGQWSDSYGNYTLTDFYMPTITPSTAFWQLAKQSYKQSQWSSKHWIPRALDHSLWNILGSRPSMAVELLRAAPGIHTYFFNLSCFPMYF
jgi:hypothetical protein